ncbi:hypothetical protein [Bradyrhizobium sp. S69]|uniref:hypothetical protein n=1 Tax=Bradyrhizobium sp. S69 TaxID=1641856 RepID=UPI00131E66AC|nr:hypothetical protein [Bradyrhizobium sp. S69]
MIVLPDVQLMELREATPGDLVRFDLRGASALAIIMRQTENGAVCAFLETNDEARPPFFMSMSIEGLMCMSFGGEWLLDLTFDANSFPGNSRYAEKHGVIHVGETVVAINLNRPPDDIRLRAIAFDLKAFKPVDVHRRTHAPVTSWKIWRTAAAKHEVNVEPLFSFTMSQS